MNCLYSCYSLVEVINKTRRKIDTENVAEQVKIILEIVGRSDFGVSNKITIYTLRYMPFMYMGCCKCCSVGGCGVLFR